MSYLQELRSVVGNRPLITVGAGVLIFDEDDRLLLQQRTDNSCWGIPGGTLELGETVEEAARREALEETGLVVGEMSLFGVFSGPEHFYAYPNGDQIYNVAIVFLTGDTKGDLVKQNEESRELRFFALDSLPTELNPPDKPILRRLIESRRTI